ncbi:hypothetical protein VP01_486g6 [Puccinia sorghi]|uniref:Uncharacterized protein n=1 Tax=Puccinia sorghi TaxID=27349 RepID=A0A0L6UP85_9BASI|nr:hypothetical protein VP01_486g6 [Puccinia sorghi]
MKHTTEEETSQDEKLLKEISARAFPSSSISTLMGREEQDRGRRMARPPRRAANEGSPPERERGRPAEPALPAAHAEENLKIPSKLRWSTRVRQLERCLDRNNYDKSLCYDITTVHAWALLKHIDRPVYE